MDLAEIRVSSSHEIIKYFRLEGISGGPKPCSKQRAQNWTRYSRYGLTSAEKRERIPTFFKLITFLLIQPRMQLAFRIARPCCQAIFNMFSTSSPKSFFAKLLSIQLAPTCIAAWGYSLLGQDSMFAIASLLEVPVAHLSSLSSSL